MEFNPFSDAIRGEFARGRRRRSFYGPRSLFRDGEPGLWLDPSDTSTMFQDSAGTTPVNVPGDPVGMIRDKSGNGNHATQATEAARPTYQVDANGHGYLLFDGVDDYLVTPTITPGTDKVQVVAGLRKLSDAAVGVGVEFSRDVNTNAGAFYFLYPRSAALNEPAFASRGSGGAVLAATASNSFASPRADVLTGLGDISAPSAARRVGGVQVTNTTAQGAGNYGAHEVHIGARYGSIAPFNGHIYGMIVRFGPNLTDAQIARAENFISWRTGVSV